MSQFVSWQYDWSRCLSSPIRLTNKHVQRHKLWLFLLHSSAGVVYLLRPNQWYLGRNYSNEIKKIVSKIFWWNKIAKNTTKTMAKNLFSRIDSSLGMTGYDLTLTADMSICHPLAVDFFEHLFFLVKWKVFSKDFLR